MGPDGALYVIEWGTQFGGGPDAKLVRIEFLGNRPAVTGDYNFDNTVDAADYVVWRKNLGSTTALSADGNGDRLVDARDHAVWRANFGASLEMPGIGGNVAAAPSSTSSIDDGEPEVPGLARNQFATEEGIAFARPETRSAFEKSSTSSIARNKPSDVGRNGGDDLLLLATDRVLRSRGRDSFKPLEILSDEDPASDKHRQSLIDGSLALAFEVWQ